MIRWPTMRPAITSLYRAASRKSIEAISNCEPAHDAGFIAFYGEIFNASGDEILRPGAILAIDGERRCPTFHFPGHKSDGASATAAFFFTHNSLVRVISINSSGKRRS